MSEGGSQYKVDVVGRRVDVAPRNGGVKANDNVGIASLGPDECLRIRLPAVEVGQDLINGVMALRGVA